MDKTLSGKSILITGGTSELGRSIVRRALAAQARVFFTFYSRTEEAEMLKKEGARGFPLDLADTRAIDDFARKIKDETEKLDALVHNAAVVRDRTIQNMTEEDWDDVMAVNLKAPYYLTKKLLSLMLKNPGSKILMITSRAAFRGGVGVSNYAASKAGLVGLVKSLAQELGKRKILVNAVNPGFMRSRMTESLPEEVIARNKEASVLGEISDPGEVADFIVFLLSGHMSQVTGQVFHYESRSL